MRDKIRKIIKYAMLDYSENPAFIHFRLLNAQSQNSAIRKLAENGITANKINYNSRYYIKINTQSK